MHRFEASAAAAAEGYKPASLASRIQLTDIPFPKDRSFCAYVNLSSPMERRQAFKILILRWHPDKFFGKYRDLFEEGNADEIQRRVGETFLAVKAAFDKAEKEIRQHED